MQATEALLEVRKFDAFNRMSAFVVHDLKNIVAQLSLMMKNAKRLHNNPEFQQDMLMTVENSLDRMRQLMLQLREGPTPPGTARAGRSGGSLRRIARRPSRGGARGRADHRGKAVARGHEDGSSACHRPHGAERARRHRKADGRVWLRMAPQGTQAMIEVGDTGHGMSRPSSSASGCSSRSRPRSRGRHGNRCL
jgi:signal transduction histidine kinase